MIYTLKISKIFQAAILLTVLPCFVFANSNTEQEKVKTADSLPANSAVMPSVAKDSRSQVGLVYQPVSYVVTTQILHNRY